MFECKKSKIEGCVELFPSVFEDNRGSFVKVFHKNYFQNFGLESNFVEEYYSHSFKNVIRGLHFQMPPEDHSKVVYCLAGSAFDVVVDLRRGSPTYGKTATFELNSKTANMVYIPKGMAHGFCSTSESTTMVYKTSTVYDPGCDAGILWNSIGIVWPTLSPIMSERDKSFSDFQSFDSPFSI